MKYHKDTHNRLYKYVGISFLIVIAAHFAISLFIEDKFPYHIFRSVTFVWFWWAVIACSIAFLLEFYSENKLKTINMLKSNSFKIISALSAMPILVLTNINIDQFINEYTSLDPSLLPNAALALKMIFVPLSWLVIMTFVLFVLMIKEQRKLDLSEHEPSLFEIFSSQDMNSDDKKKHGFKYLKNYLRVIGIVGTIYFSMLIIENIKKDDGFLNLVAKVLILKTEYFKSSICADLNKYEYVADIGRGNVSVYDLESKTFKVKQCKFPG